MLRNKKLLIIVAVFLIGVLFYAIFCYGSVSVSGNDRVMVDGKLYETTNVKLRPGSHKIEIYNPLRHVEEASATVFPFRTSYVQNKGSDFGIEEILASTNYALPSSYYVNAYRLLVGNQWLVAHINNRQPTGDGYTLILKYSYGDGWQLYNSGTGLVDDRLKRDSPEVFNYLTNND